MFEVKPTDLDFSVGAALGLLSTAVQTQQRAHFLTFCVLVTDLMIR